MCRHKLPSLWLFSVPPSLWNDPKTAWVVALNIVNTHIYKVDTFHWELQLWYLQFIHQTDYIQQL